MARTRTLVENDLAQASQLVKKYETSLSGTPGKKELRKDPQWRRLQSAVGKFKNQLFFIDKRNKKAEKPEA